MVDVLSAYFSERVLSIGADSTIIIGSASADSKGRNRLGRTVSSHARATPFSSNVDGPRG